MVRKCQTCSKLRPAAKEPLLPSSIPDRPWSRLGMDLFELKGKTYLIVVDYLSRWIDMRPLHQLSSAATINAKANATSQLSTSNTNSTSIASLTRHCGDTRHDNPQWQSNESPRQTKSVKQPERSHDALYVRCPGHSIMHAVATALDSIL
ncbi:hypothetical protein V1264_007811 [Littorina saxatilis]|uniref:Integrase catalytic domain-containing protein n=1 Tax=Littorina saxatilis TaxID=31220 RepID=A0AAN9AWB5_9CAEN